MDMTDRWADKHKKNKKSPVYVSNPGHWNSLRRPKPPLCISFWKSITPGNNLFLGVIKMVKQWKYMHELVWANLTSANVKLAQVVTSQMLPIIRSCVWGVGGGGGGGGREGIIIK